MSAQITNQNNPIIIGGKPEANYVLAVQARLALGEKEIVLRARGKNISKALNAANLAVNIGLPVRRGELKWGQETGPNNQKSSFVEIVLVANQ